MTGRTYSSFRTNQKRERPFKIIKIGLTRDREELYSRINQRVDNMMQDGFLEEAKMLYAERDLNALNTVGYKELFTYLEGTWSLDEAVERIKGNTRRYARKQLTWYKKDPEMKWFTLDSNKQIQNIEDDIYNYIIQQS
jgi:tRNA dimethylallyltransferase